MNNLTHRDSKVTIAYDIDCGSDSIDNLPCCIQSATTKCRRCINVNLILLLTRLLTMFTTLVQHVIPEAMRERDSTHRMPECKRTVEVPREAGFLFIVSVGQTCVTKPSMLFENLGFPTIGREYGKYKGCKSQLIGIVADNTVIGPALDVQVTLQYGRYCFEIKINSLQIENIVSWVVINRRLDSNVTPLSEGNTN